MSRHEVPPHLYVKTANAGDFLWYRLRNACFPGFLLLFNPLPGMKNRPVRIHIFDSPAFIRNRARIRLVFSPVYRTVADQDFSFLFASKILNYNIQVITSPDIAF